MNNFWINHAYILLFFSPYYIKHFLQMTFYYY